MGRPSLCDPHNIKLRNIIDMGLTFSAMIRLFKKETKGKLHERIMEDAKKIFDAKSIEDFNSIHSIFCKWGVENVLLAERKKNEKVIKKEGPASYGQIAKTFDVVMKVVIYYSRLPDFETSEKILPWLNPAVDTQMMKMLKKHYKKQNPLLIKNISPWPITVEEVCEVKYQQIQDLVRKFINDEHNGDIIPVQFDDIYWNQLNR